MYPDHMKKMSLNLFDSYYNFWKDLDRKTKNKMDIIGLWRLKFSLREIKK